MSYHLQAAQYDPSNYMIAGHVWLISYVDDIEGTAVR